MQGVRLRQLVDVTSVRPSDSHVLSYDASTGRWGPAQVATAGLDDGSVTNPKLASLSVSTGNLQDNSVTGAKIPGNTIATAHIQAGAITNTLLAPTSVATGNLQDNSVTGAKIPSNTVATAHVQDGAITTVKLATGAATDGILGSRTITPAAPTLDTDTLTNLLSGLAYQVKSNSGQADWKTAPSISLETLKAHAARHLTGAADPIPLVTTSADGLMSAVDKTKLDGMSSGYGLFTNLSNGGTVNITASTDPGNTIMTLTPTQAGTYLALVHVSFKMTTVQSSATAGITFKLTANNFSTNQVAALPLPDGSAVTVGYYEQHFVTTVTVANGTTALTLSGVLSISGDAAQVVAKRTSLSLIKIG